MQDHLLWQWNAWHCPNSHHSREVTPFSLIHTEYVLMWERCSFTKKKKMKILTWVTSCGWTGWSQRSFPTLVILWFCDLGSNLQLRITTDLLNREYWFQMSTVMCAYVLHTSSVSLGLANRCLLRHTFPTDIHTTLLGTALRFVGTQPRFPAPFFLKLSFLKQPQGQMPF